MLDTNTTAAHPSKTRSVLAPSGVRVGFEIWGEGPPLVLIHGAFSDHRTNWMYAKPFLAQHFTAYAIARRGRGSTDATQNHCVRDEIADVLALVRHIGEPVHLLGHSYGGLVALGVAAEMPGLVRKLVVYEAPSPHLLSADDFDTLVRLGNAGDWHGFAMRFFGDVLRVPKAELSTLQETSDWKHILNDAPASLQDLRALARHRFEAENFRGLAMPVLLQTGTDSPPELYVTKALAAVLTNFELGPLDGQAHEAMTTAPKQYAESVRYFLHQESL